jgi:hypothetical protein
VALRNDWDASVASIKILDAARMQFARQLTDPEFAITAAGFSDFVKLEQLLDRLRRRAAPSGT